MIELDKITIKLAISGQKRAFKSLYDWYAPFIWRVILKMTGDEDIARELIQDTFVKVHNYLKNYRAESLLSTWIYRIAYNSVMAHLSYTLKMKSHDSYEDKYQGTEKSDSYENTEIVNKIMEELSADEKFLLVAREIDDISFDELSLVTGETAGSLRTKLHRLKERIRKHFHQHTVVKEAV